ncbi:hypothetical protein BU23DRAFT_585904 [Bimuria novae-zelandiae CBS 107.79]|uniref:alpha-1,3-glucan synthase n=1 Tax=Bimuria novae-zelandiae CBS 107.79 TaxID=1447943 RepID=A0A6A5VS47_9PLEO|nr:hypothetical protein BU23DRAFT_585904 [Bimuria novae-zelandiae CBS 107.79]
MFAIRKLLSLAYLSLCATALRYDPVHEGWNLNLNRTATDPLHYWAEWENHTFNPSPKSWWFPFYVVTLDRYVDGDPTNNGANGTSFEHDWTSNQFRFGGDAKGMMNNLDYIQGMGIKAIYFSGTPFINMPWSNDGFGALDFTLLDHHHGKIEDWRALIAEMHRRGMYAIMENTLGTMGDLLQWVGKENETAPFKWSEYDVRYKSSRHYHDFSIGNNLTATCNYPRMWSEDGYPLTNSSVLSAMDRPCKDSEFDQYGDMKGVGPVPVWETQLAKFAGVQDRLRTWHGEVLEKIMHFSCIQIAMLDLDGFRMDKAAQTPVDVHAKFSDYQRECAKRYGKDNFLIVGEIVSKIPYASLLVGRGKQPDMKFDNHTHAVAAIDPENDSNYLRKFGSVALDSDAFHYPFYGAMTRFLGLDGPIGLEGVDFVAIWHELLLQTDMGNAYTGKFDPRFLWGMTNQDVFRWLMIANLLMPGAPFHLWGDEQESYILENQASDYVFGRTPMASQRAWQLHGCYNLGEEVYVDMPFDKALRGCEDDSVSLDHRDPSHFMRNVIKRHYELREQYPALNDGAYLQTLSSQTYNVYLHGSLGLPSPTGIWSVYRGPFPDVQDFAEAGDLGNQGVWFIYSNDNKTVNYTFNCKNVTEGLIAPYPGGTIVKNLFFPYEEYTLGTSAAELGLENSADSNGCLDSLEMQLWSYKLLVPRDKFAQPRPTITRVVPGHDARLVSKVGDGEPQIVPIEVHFSSEMNCETAKRNFTIRSNTGSGQVARLNASSVTCSTVLVENKQQYGELANVHDGIHVYTLNNISTESTGLYTQAVDHFMFRVGQPDNPMVFPATANYSSSLLQRGEKTGALTRDYTAVNASITEQPWSGSKDQAWKGDHIEIRYWSEMAGSMEHVQHGGAGFELSRRWPHMHVTGPWNLYGFDSGLPDEMRNTGKGQWHFDIMTEYPTRVILSVWGINPDGQPDKSKLYGDVDHDGVLDWLPPTSLGKNVVNVTNPGMPYVGVRLIVNDGDLRYTYQPIGSAWRQLTITLLLALVPLSTGVVAIWLFLKSFYCVKFNQRGMSEKRSVILAGLPTFSGAVKHVTPFSPWTPNPQRQEGFTIENEGRRRTVLIATMEYEIEDWGLKVKIGGLGVMASTMGKNLQHQNLIWVVPCVGGIDYLIDEITEPMRITILGQIYNINIQYHHFQNITFVLLDAPQRMDDLGSALYYSAWNQCIAEVIKRFPEIDPYHINDYHGTLAPLYLLSNAAPPCCLSLHNTEFQGLWSIKHQKDLDEICRVFNLSKEIVHKYVQFGEVFNMLHAGASYLRIHQRGFGAVGVSKKYGKRSFARYPIFWGLTKIGSLPNPDPSDTAPWNKDDKLPKSVAVDADGEAQRGMLRTQAQEWAGLQVDPDAELFVFVGRWSMQKGIDLIADVFPSILEKNPKAQLICVGPVIDLYGTFAAAKLQRLMEMYPERVCSKPEFTVLPPCIFSGAEFALIPSRDEPFGLVAVEFGRKRALGVGSRVGGLGTMPGWWFTIESVATKHLVRQFQRTVKAAMASFKETRAEMRARSSLQRFPVAQWLEGLEKLQSGSITTHARMAGARASRTAGTGTPAILSPLPSVPGSTFVSPTPTRPSSRIGSRVISRAASTIREEPEPTIFDSAGQSVVSSGAASPVDTPSPGSSSELQSPESGNGNSISPIPSATTEQQEGNVSTNDLRRTLGHVVVSRNMSRQSSRESSSSQSSTDARNTAPNSPIAGTSSPSLQSVVGEEKRYRKQKVEPFFTDAQGVYARQFERLLGGLNGRTSTNELCIEDFIIKSEKKWFARFYDAKLGVKRSYVKTVSSHVEDAGGSNSSNNNNNSSSSSSSSSGSDAQIQMGTIIEDEFELGNDYTPPEGFKKIVQYKIRDWPMYSLFVALGQILSANSYQITLLSGEIGQTARKLYVVASIYLAGSLVWWTLFRTLQSRYVIAIPFVCYALAFFVLGMAPYGTSMVARGWIQNVATGLYALASGSGSLFFALNFGSEGGTATHTWVFRACVVQGTQQLYVTVLWYWGAHLSAISASGHKPTGFSSSPYITAVTTPVAVLLAFIAVALFRGLPDFYRSAPGNVPSFYSALRRRKIILWFFVVVVVQNYFLSAPYGRNWRYLWSSQLVPAWGVAVLVLVFFGAVWVALFAVFRGLSVEHSWILPIFAIGLGAPRWAQMLWGTSGMGSFVPWAPTPAVGALIGRALWLWLGILDALQGVGFGMILLQAMTRFHVAFTLTAAQVVGSVATMVARATAPNQLGPGPVFPNLTLSMEGLGDVVFWVALGLQGVVCVGFFIFFRKEQLFKP